MKVLSSFPEVELYWLLNGKGDFPSQKEDTPEKPKKNKSFDMLATSNISNQDIDRIIVFFKDGSFKNYQN